MGTWVHIAFNTSVTFMWIRDRQTPVPPEAFSKRTHNTSDFSHKTKVQGRPGSVISGWVPSSEASPASDQR